MLDWRAVCATPFSSLAHSLLPSESEGESSVLERESSERSKRKESHRQTDSLVRSNCTLRLIDITLFLGNEPVSAYKKMLIKRLKNIVLHLQLTYFAAEYFVAFNS